MKMTVNKIALFVGALSVITGVSADDGVTNQLVQSKQAVSSASFKTKSSPNLESVTFLQGKQREDALRKILGERYREGASPVISQGVDINSRVYRERMAKSSLGREYRKTVNASSSLSSDTLPNDPFFLDWQLINFEKGAELLSLSSPNSITPINITIPFAPPVIGLVESEYSSNDDINVVDGMNFWSIDLQDGRVMPRVDDDYDNYSNEACVGAGTNWHGLGVASIASSIINNSVGLAGYSQNDVVYAKGMHCEFGWSNDISMAMYWLSGATIGELPDNLYHEILEDTWRSRPAVDVINMSLGTGTECEELYVGAFAYASRKSIPVVVAAGNEDKDGVSSPASCEGAIGVVALDGDGNKAPYSNYGSGSDIAVIGSGVAAYNVPEQYDENDDISYLITENVRFMSGTSMAAPIVTSVISQIRTVAPALSAEEILQIIQETADPFPESSNCNEEYYCGPGILNAERAINVASGRLIEKQAVARPAIERVDVCDTVVLTLNAEGLKKICEAYDIDLSGLRYMAREYQDVRYEIYEVAQGDTQAQGESPIATTVLPTATLHDLDFDQHNYVVRACEGEACLSSIEAVLEPTSIKPDICN